MQDAQQPSSLVPFVSVEKDGLLSVNLRVEGMHCAGCASRIAAALNAETNVSAQVDLATNRLVLRWKGVPERVDSLVEKARLLGYGFAPLDQNDRQDAARRESHLLKRCLWLSGLGLVAVMGLMALKEIGYALPEPWDLDLIAALVATPVTLIASWPFFKAAARALKGRHTNMDVPISAAILLTLGLGLFALLHDGTAPSFDSALMLIFLLLLGRVLDSRTRGRARSAAEGLLSFLTGEALILPDDGESPQRIPIRLLRPGMILVVAAGEKIAADGAVIDGISEIDPSFITGETLSQPVSVGDTVLGGMVNISAPLRIRLTRTGADSLPGEILKLMDKAQQGHATYVRLADKVAQIYTPFVFLTALGSFGLWLWLGAPWPHALEIATTVLVITCPCALGLAVPAVQVIASTRLFRAGLLLKTGDALERLAKVDTILFDKTGTLTQGRPKLVNADTLAPETLRLAASLAASSRHPLALALCKAARDLLPPGPAPSFWDIRERPGLGLEALSEGGTVRLGRRSWCGPKGEAQDALPDLWLEVGQTQTRFAFEDELRQDAAAVVQKLRAGGYRLALLSGDRLPVVEALARKLGIDSFKAACSPLEKGAEIERLKQKGAHVLMVGDGLNDAAALALADVSLSPSTALDIAQNAASIVFQGESLNAVPFAIEMAKKAQILVKQNFALALLYNVIAVPLAVAGYATPALAAAAMAASSITVVLNAGRLGR